MAKQGVKELKKVRQLIDEVRALLKQAEFWKQPDEEWYKDAVEELDAEILRRKMP